MDSYRVPAAPARAVVTERKSEFIAQLSPAAEERDALDFLAAVRAEHRAAGHHVYAYMLRSGAKSRCSDDGEPAKTAGLPVLSAIGHAGICDCIIVVTRYFGGILLGTGGLSRAYGAAAAAVLRAAEILTMRPARRICLCLPYPLYDSARRLLDAHGARGEGEPVFGADVRLCALVPGEAVDKLQAAVRELLRSAEGCDMSDVFYAPI